MSQLCHRCWQHIRESKHILPLIRLNWTNVPQDDIQLCYWLFNSSSIKYIVTQTHLMSEKNSYPRKQLEIWQMNSQQTHNSLSQVVKKLKHMKTHFVSSVCVSVCVSRSVVSDSLWPCGLRPTRLLCPRNSPGKNTGVGSHFLLQGIFPGTEPESPTLQADCLPSEPPGKPFVPTRVQKGKRKAFI